MLRVTASDGSCVPQKKVSRFSKSVSLKLKTQLLGNRHFSIANLLECDPVARGKKGGEATCVARTTQNKDEVSVLSQGF